MNMKVFVILLELNNYSGIRGEPIQYLSNTKENTTVSISQIFLTKQGLCFVVKPAAWFAVRPRHVRGVVLQSSRGVSEYGVLCLCSRASPLPAGVCKGE